MSFLKKIFGKKKQKIKYIDLKDIYTIRKNGKNYSVIVKPKNEIGDLLRIKLSHKKLKEGDFIKKGQELFHLRKHLNSKEKPHVLFSEVEGYIVKPPSTNPFIKHGNILIEVEIEDHDILIDKLFHPSLDFVDSKKYKESKYSTFYKFKEDTRYPIPLDISIQQKKDPFNNTEEITTSKFHSRSKVDDIRLDFEIGYKNGEGYIQFYFFRKNCNLKLGDSIKFLFKNEHIMEFKFMDNSERYDKYEEGVVNTKIFSLEENSLIQFLSTPLEAWQIQMGKRKIDGFRTSIMEDRLYFQRKLIGSARCLKDVFLKKSV